MIGDYKVDQIKMGFKFLFDNIISFELIDAMPYLGTQFSSHVRECHFVEWSVDARVIVNWVLINIVGTISAEEVEMVTWFDLWGEMTTIQFHEMAPFTAELAVECSRGPHRENDHAIRSSRQV